MPKLFVQFGRINKTHQPFHPTLRIDKFSGFCKNQWKEMHFRPGCFCGAGCVSAFKLQDAVKEYFSELKRMNYRVVTEEEVM